MGPRGAMAPSLLSCFSVASMSWFTWTIVSIILLCCDPLTYLLLATPLPVFVLKFLCKAVYLEAMNHCVTALINHVLCLVSKPLVVMANSLIDVLKQTQVLTLTLG